MNTRTPVPFSVRSSRAATEAWVAKLIPGGEVIVDPEANSVYVAVGVDVIGEFGTDTGFADGKPCLIIYN
jgi:hypothetical protein